MTFDEIMRLPEKKDFIPELTEFLNTHPRDELFYDVLIKLARIYFEDNSFEGLALLKSVSDDPFFSENPDLYFRFIDLKIDYHLSILDTDEALKMIEKKEVMFPNDEKKWKFDYIRLLIEEEKLSEAKALLADLKDCSFETFESIIYEKYLLLVYTLLNQRERTIELINHIIIEKRDENLLSLALIAKAYFLIEQDRSLDALEQIKGIKPTKLWNITSLCHFLKIYSFYKKDDFKSIALYTTENEDDLVRIHSGLLKKRLYPMISDAYLRNDDHISAKIFDSLLAGLKEKPSSKVLENGLSKPKIVTEDINELYRTIEYMNQTLEGIFKTDIDRNIQEAFRQTMIPFSKVACFEQAVLTLLDKDVTIVTYKKGLAYDYYRDSSSLHNTPEEKIILSKSEWSLVAKDDFGQMDDIIKHHPLPESKFTSMVGFPLLKNDECYGALTFYGADSLVLKNYNYELLKFYVVSLDYYFESYYMLSNHKKTYNEYSLAFNKNPGYFKYQIDEEIYLNDSLAKLLSLAKNINIHDYLVVLKNEFVNKYKDHVNQIKKGIIKDGDIRYQLKNGVWIKEMFHAFYDDKKRYLVSNLVDISDLVELETTKSFNETCNYITGLKNRKEALIAIDEAIRDNRFSLLLMDIDRFRYFNDINGTELGDLALKAVGRSITETFKDSQVFHLSSDEIMILFKDTNDSRTVLNRANQLLEELKYLVPKYSPQFKFHYSIGLFRYPIQSRDKNPDKILKYVSHALSIAKRRKRNLENSIAYFDLADYQGYQEEQMLMTQVSEAIDSSQMVIRYQQVIDLEKGRILHYEAQTHLPTYAKTDQYIYDIALKRGMSSHIDRFLISKAAREISELYKKTGKYIRVSLPIHVSTFMMGDFFSFLEEELKLNSIQPEILILEIMGKFTSNSVIERITSLKQIGIRVIVNEIADLLKIPADYFKIHDINLYLKNDYTKLMLHHINEIAKSQDILLIVADVKQREESDLLRQIKVEYVEGPLYGKRLTIKDILSKMEG